MLPATAVVDAANFSVRRGSARAGQQYAVGFQVPGTVQPRDGGSLALAPHYRRLRSGPDPKAKSENEARPLNPRTAIEVPATAL